jgi:probable rRNA maturation factor
MYQVLVKRLKDSPSEKFIENSVINQLNFRKADASLVEVEVVGLTKMLSINKKYRSIDSATDVLSFPVAEFPNTTDQPKMLGTIFLCSDIIKKNSCEYGKTFEEEFDFMLKHGVDHLLGFHHK